MYAAHELSMHVCMDVKHVCMYVKHVCMYVCMLSMYVCMLSMHVCMYVKLSSKEVDPIPYEKRLVFER